jgi:hypothetical protein
VVIVCYGAVLAGWPGGIGAVSGVLKAFVLAGGLCGHSQAPGACGLLPGHFPGSGQPAGQAAAGTAAARAARVCLAVRAMRAVMALSRLWLAAHKDSSAPIMSPR